MRLTTIGRRTGKERSAILGYFEDGPNLVTIAMNGWADPEPAWWLNLQAHPDATVDLKDGRRAVRGRAAVGDDGYAFDWTVVLIGGWLVGGFYLDAWAHHHTTLETFFTPWHAVLYSGYFAVAAWLAFALIRNHGRGLPWREALPAGDGLSLVGAGIFLIGGLGDMACHIGFGIEVDVEALLSPPASSWPSAAF
jgi:deazaflavin-dependent oxidoreductase (nitroreductase family)